jgi:lysophospholipid acyltransferase (LPLAT)-like uncharacterized protein
MSANGAMWHFLAAVRLTHQNCKKLVAMSSSPSTSVLLLARLAPSLGLPWVTLLVNGGGRWALVAAFLT